MNHKEQLTADGNSLESAGQNITQSANANRETANSTLEIRGLINSWDAMRKEKHPLYLYGMGDGAEKIISVLSSKGIEIAGVFASDDFVRGQSFAGYKVRRFSDIVRRADDAAVVVAFGTDKPDVIKRIEDMAKKRTVYVPDVPLVGGGLFTYEYCMLHMEEISQVYGMLADDDSRLVYENIIKFKITGNLDFLAAATSGYKKPYGNILTLSEDEVFADLGAYNGDTVKEFAECTHGRYEKIYAAEPDVKSFRKLCRNTESMRDIVLINKAAWSISGKVPFDAQSGRQSAVSAGGNNEVDTLAVDELLKEGTVPSLIKIDVEGSELQAIWGASKTIAEHTPKMTVALYHRNEDIFALPLLIKSMNPSYKFHITHSPCIPAWETNLTVF
ncbi:MAG: FkbM family methyltransferase [Oscillospiraceae bacterium]|nr:FkbM family methyltransferase [Oscillospiraceae bacterium]